MLKIVLYLKTERGILPLKKFAKEEITELTKKVIKQSKGTKINIYKEVKNLQKRIESHLSSENRNIYKIASSFPDISIEMKNIKKSSEVFDLKCKAEIKKCSDQILKMNQDFQLLKSKYEENSNDRTYAVIFYFYNQTSDETKI